MLAYQLYSPEENWYSSYIWTNKETAEEMWRQMNKDLENSNANHHYELRIVEIV